MRVRFVTGAKTRWAANPTVIVVVRFVRRFQQNLTTAVVDRKPCRFRCGCCARGFGIGVGLIVVIRVVQLPQLLVGLGPFAPLVKNCKTRDLRARW